MVTTINKFRIELRDLVTALDGSVNQFYWKDLKRAMSENGDINYPLVCAYKATGNLTMNQDRIQLTIDIADKIYQDFTSLNDVESDTFKLCRDIYNGMQSVRWKKIGRIESCSVRKFVAEGTDYVAGHTMTMDFNLRDKNGVCDLPFFGYDFDQVVSGEATQVEVFNSDMSYTQVVDCGGTLELPDISYEVTNSIGTVLAGANVPSVNNIETELADVDNIDSDGSIVPTPAGVAFTCTPIAPCEDGTAVLKDEDGNTLSTTDIPSGDTVDIEAPNGSYTVEYENGTLIESGSVLSGGSVTVEVPNPIVCEDATLTLNTSQFLTVSSGSTTDISLVDQNDVDITPISVVGDVIKVNIPSGGGSPSVGATLIKTGSLITKALKDDGDLQLGRTVDFLNLGFAPIHSDGSPTVNTSTKRFTDELGGQTYTNKIHIDWSTYNNVDDTVLGFFWDINEILSSQKVWSVANALASSFSYAVFTSDWFLPNIRQMFNLAHQGSNNAFNYPPFNINSGYQFWSSTNSFNDPDNEAKAIVSVRQSAESQNKAGVFWFMPCRVFTAVGTTLS